MSDLPPVYVDHFCHALGSVTRDIGETAAAGLLYSDVQALTDAGFRTHHTCAEGETAYDLAKRCVAPLAEQGLLEGIGAIVYATCLPENGNVAPRAKFTETGDVKYVMDYPASRLQADFGLDDAIVIGLNQQACTSMLGSLRIARMALAAEPELGKVLCLTADRFPEGARYEQVYNLISDGAAACVASTEPHGFEIKACGQITNGAMSWASDDETVGSYFAYTHRLITQTLAKCGLAVADLEWIVAQNTSEKAWQILARLFRIDFERVWFPSLPEVGHIISADNIVNLERLVAAGTLEPGQKALLYMAGFGLNWQCTVLERV